MGLPVTLILTGICLIGKPSIATCNLSSKFPHISLYNVILISTDLFAERFPKKGSQVKATP